MSVYKRKELLLINEVEYTHCRNNQFVIKGFSYLQGIGAADLITANTSLYLENIKNSTERYFFDVVNVVRKDITFAYGNGVNYDYSGIEATLDLTTINKIGNKRFRLYVKMTIDSKKMISEVAIPFKFYSNFDALFVENFTRFRKETVDDIEGKTTENLLKQLNHERTHVLFDRSSKSKDISILPINISIHNKKIDITFNNKLLNGKKFIIRDSKGKVVLCREINHGKVNFFMHGSIFRLFGWTPYLEYRVGDEIQMNCDTLFNLKSYKGKYNKLLNNSFIRKRSSSFGWYIVRHRVNRFMKI